jgi:cytoskeletal protein RodZ
MREEEETRTEQTLLSASSTASYSTMASSSSFNQSYTDTSPTSPSSLLNITSSEDCSLEIYDERGKDHGQHE